MFCLGSDALKLEDITAIDAGRVPDILKISEIGLPSIQLIISVAREHSFDRWTSYSGRRRRSVIKRCVKIYFNTWERFILFFVIEAATSSWNTS